MTVSPYRSAFLIACRLLVLCIITCGSAAPPGQMLITLVFDRSLPRDNVVFILPGMNKRHTDKGYDSIAAFYLRSGITPVSVDPDWKRIGLNRFTEASAQLVATVRDSFPRSCIHLFGFSFGAAIALKAAQELPCRQVLLCSMSPIFAEDLALQIFPFRQITPFFIDYSTSGLTWSVNTGVPAFFLYGDHDSFVINKAIIGRRIASFKNSTTIIVPDARHDISGKSYLKAVEAAIRGNGG